MAHLSRSPCPAYHEGHRIDSGRETADRAPAAKSDVARSKEVTRRLKISKAAILFSPKAASDNPLRRSSAVANPGSESVLRKHGTPVYRTLMIDYNVGDGGSAYEVMVGESLAGTFDLLRHRLDFRKWGFLK